MAMDDQARATVRVLLDRYPRGYAAEEAGLSLATTAAGLFRLLCLALLADDSAPAGATTTAVQALWRRWDSAHEMATTSAQDRARALAEVGYPDPERASARLGDAADYLLVNYEGDLGKLREDADGDTRQLRALLRKVPGLDDEAGYAVFVRDAQVFWPEAGPFLDYHAQHAATRLGLSAKPGDLLRDMARTGGQDGLGLLAGALALVDARDEYEQVTSQAR